MHDDESREHRAVDGVDQEQAAGLQHAGDLVEHAVEVSDVFQDVDADDVVDAPISERDRLAAPDTIVNPQPFFCGMGLRGLDCRRDGVDADHGRPPLRQRLRHEAAAAPQVENGHAVPGADDPVEMGEAGRHEVVQEPQEPLRPIPPVGCVGAIDGEVISHRVCPDQSRPPPCHSWPGPTHHDRCIVPAKGRRLRDGPGQPGVGRFSGEVQRPYWFLQVHAAVHLLIAE